MILISIVVQSSCGDSALVSAADGSGKNVYTRDRRKFRRMLLESFRLHRVMAEFLRREVRRVPFEKFIKAAQRFLQAGRSCQEVRLAASGEARDNPIIESFNAPGYIVEHDGLRRMRIDHGNLPHFDDRVRARFGHGHIRR